MPAISVDHLRGRILRSASRSRKKCRYYRDLGADLQQLGALYDLEARPGKAPLAYTDYVTRGRFVDDKWRQTVVHISGSSATGGLGLLNELVHENGHAVYMMAIHVRPAFMPRFPPEILERWEPKPRSSAAGRWNSYLPLSALHLGKIVLADSQCAGETVPIAGKKDISAVWFIKKIYENTQSRPTNEL
jgi:hypothetical protein